MGIRKRNLARLASFSALGAGALGVAAGNAHGATVAPLTFPSGIVVGPDGVSSQQITALGQTLFNIRWQSRHYSSYRMWKWTALASVSGAQVKDQMGYMVFAKTGQVWDSVPGFGDYAGILIAHRSVYRSYRSGVGWMTPSQSKWVLPGNTDGTLQYAMFRFSMGAGSYDYGWLGLSTALTPNRGPDVTLQSGYYDTTPGEEIAAGDTGAVPEPSTLGLTGLAALALGAVGLRRWRVARKQTDQ